MKKKEKKKKRFKAEAVASCVEFLSRSNQGQMAGAENVQKTATTRSSKSTNLSTNGEHQRSLKSHKTVNKPRAPEKLGNLETLKKKPLQTDEDEDDDRRTDGRTERDPKSSNPKNSQFCNASGIRCWSDGPMVQQVGGEVSFGPMVRSLPATRRPI
jgi:hypothetical protein